MAYFALTYEYGRDYMATRDPFKDGHTDHLKTAIARGEVLFAGAAMEGAVPFGFVLFSVEDAAKVEDFARTDPYVTGGVSKAWKVRPWYGVAGPGAIGG
jgi:uncharacterized protein